MLYFLFFQIDITLFPFDTQECKLKFGSWTYHNASIDVEISEGHEWSAKYKEYREGKGKEQKGIPGNKTFEEWYSVEWGYEKNGVST